MAENEDRDPGPEANDGSERDHPEREGTGSIDGIEPAPRAGDEADALKDMDELRQAAASAPAEPHPHRDFPRTLAERMERRVEINVPDRDNDRLTRIVARINQDDELYALWTAANVTAITRLGMTDHGPVHVKIVMNIAIRLLHLLEEAGIELSIVRDHGLTRDDAAVVVALAALLHDLGMSIHRVDHEGFSLFVAQAKIRELLEDEYDVATATIVRAEILHAIIAHRSGGSPLTLEAGIVRIADALDMAKGRSRIPFDEGSVSIHSVSAAAIDAVHIERGKTKPIRLVIEMTNSAGVFQLDQLFREKLRGSGLEPYIEVEAEIEGEKEKRLLQGFRL